MGYQVLARKYRPQRFADVRGQEHVTRTLLNAIQQGRIAHGYIFSGHRGIGKTTIARILAMALNCRETVGGGARPTAEPCGECDACREIRAGNAVDVIEIDAATNRGIDEIRELREAARYSPARDRYKIYILDEAHQITDAAFNALLKTLEEPPEHVIFMMATTQPEDIPQTIRSRSQHFSFHAVTFDEIVAQLTEIAGAEAIQAAPGALALLAEAGDGSMRDALSIMDQAIASAPVENGAIHLEAEPVRALMGTVPNAVFERLMELASAGDAAAVMREANRLLDAGNSPSQLARQMVRYLRNCLMARLGGEKTELLQVSADERARASRTAALFGEEELTRFLQVMLRTFDDLNYRQEQRFHFELGLMKLVHLGRILPLEQILSRLEGGAGSSGAGPARGANPGPGAAPANPGTHASRETAGMASHGSAGEPQPRQKPEPVIAAAVSPAEPPREPVQEASAAPPASGSAVLSLERVREIAVSALSAGGHAAAATLLGAGQWSEGEGGAIEVVAGVKKVMLGLTMNPLAWKIVREALKEAGSSQKLTVIPGEKQAGDREAAAPMHAPPVAAGGIQAEALENPLVRQARDLFQAEVRSVLDLRERR